MTHAAAPEDPGASRPSDARTNALVVAVSVVLLGVAGFAWFLLLQPGFAVDPAPMADLPQEFAGWRSIDVPVDDAVAEMLRADYNLQRVYVHALSAAVDVYVGYYGTTRGGRPEHTPRMCYRAQGWDMSQERELEIDAQLGLRVNEMLVSNADGQQLVHFWYRTRRRTGILDDTALIFDHALGRIFDGRADGALVRLSTDVASEDDLVAARTLLASFGARFERELEAHWPIESSGAGS